MMKEIREGPLAQQRFELELSSRLRGVVFGGGGSRRRRVAYKEGAKRPSQPQVVPNAKRSQQLKTLAKHQVRFCAIFPQTIWGHSDNAD